MHVTGPEPGPIAELSARAGWAAGSDLSCMVWHGMASQDFPEA